MNRDLGTLELFWPEDESIKIIINYKLNEIGNYLYDIKYRDKENFNLDIDVNPSLFCNSINASLPLYISRISKLEFGDTIAIFGNNNFTISLCNFLHMSGYNPILFSFNSVLKKRYIFTSYFFDNFNLESKKIIENIISSSNVYTNLNFLDLTSDEKITNYIFQISPFNSDITLIHDSPANFRINTYTDIHVKGSQLTFLNTPDLTLNLFKSNFTNNFSFSNRCIEFSRNCSEQFRNLLFWSIKA